LPNPASIKLHERFGLKQTGLLPQFSWKFDRWYDLAILTGRLSELKGPPPALKSVEEVWELKRP
jgi:L-amino acid N-acyltransferase YncA